MAQKHLFFHLTITWCLVLSFHLKTSKKSSKLNRAGTSTFSFIPFFFKISFRWIGPFYLMDVSAKVRHIFYSLIVRLLIYHRCLFMSISISIVKGQLLNIGLYTKYSLGQSVADQGLSRPGTTTYYLAKFFLKTAWKWKNLDREGVCPWYAP